eukprot:Partr_v1_DN27885_c0_g1_i2_m23354 putative importin
MDPNLAAAIEQQLNVVVQGADTAQIKAATASLNQFYAKPDCVPALMQILMQGQPQIRQIAAVELRKKSIKYWAQLPDAVTVPIKNGLVEIALKDGEKRIRHAATRVISEVAAIELPAGKWQDLLKFVQDCCASQAVAEREVGFYIIYALLDVIAETFTQHLGQLLTLFANGLADPASQDVKSYSLDSLSKLCDIIDPSDETAVKSFKKLVPSMVAALEFFIVQQDEDKVSSAIECFTSIISSDIPVFNNHIAELVQFFLTVGANTNLSDEIRTQSLSFLMWVILFKKNKVIRLKLVEPIIKALMEIGCEEEPEDLDDDSPAGLSFKVLNTLAANVPPQHVFPFVWGILINFIQQQHAGCRKSSMSSLAAISEGCSDFIRNEFKVDKIIPYIVTTLGDPEIAVRRASLIALAALTSDMGAEVCEFHASLLPLVFNLLGDSSDHIRRIALETLDILLENLGDNIKPYLNPLMEKLLVTLDNANIKTEADNTITILSAIGSAAHASEKDFQPFFEHVFPRLEKFMALGNKDEEDEMNLRVSATDAMGAVAIAVGKEMFGPHLAKYMDLVMNGLLMGAGKLPESAFLFFGMMARVFEKDFAPFLGPVIEALFVAAQIEEEEVQFDEESEGLDVEDMNEAIAKKYRANSAIADEKEAAIDALGVIIESTKDNFMPYLQKSLQIVQELCDNSHDGVRKACMETLFRILTTVTDIYHPALDWEAGMPPKYQLHNDVVGLIKVVMDEVIRSYEEEEEMMVVSNINTELMEAVKSVGPMLIAQHMEPLCQHILTLLQKKAVCQIEFDEEDAGEDEDLAEFDALLISTTVDLVGTLSQACGEAFAPAFQMFWPLIGKYYRPNKPVADRSMVIGVIGEVASGLKAEVTAFTADMLNLVVPALQDEDPEVRSNAAYAAGTICQNTKMDLSSHYSVIL